MVFACRHLGSLCRFIRFLLFITLLWLWGRVAVDAIHVGHDALRSSPGRRTPGRPRRHWVLSSLPLRGQQPFSFCIGAGICRRCGESNVPSWAKAHFFCAVAAVLVGAVLLICVAPYFVFTPALLHMRREGLLKYGGFARAVGEQFEQKWLNHLKASIRMF